MYYQNSHLTQDLIINCDMDCEEDFDMDEVQEFSSQFYEQDQRDSEEAISKILENADICYQEILCAIADMDKKKRDFVMEALTEKMSTTRLVNTTVNMNSGMKAIGMNINATAFIPMAFMTTVSAPVVLEPTEFSKHFSEFKIQIAKFTNEGINGKNYKKYYYFNQMLNIHDDRSRFSRHLKSPKGFMEKINGVLRAHINHCDISAHDPFGQMKSEDVIDMDDFEYYLENPEDEYIRSVRLIISFEKVFMFAFYFRPFAVDDIWYGFEVRIKTPDGEIHFFQGKWRFP